MVPFRGRGRSLISYNYRKEDKNGGYARVGTQSTLKGGVKIDSVATKRDLFVFSIIHPYSRYGFFLYTIIINIFDIQMKR